MKARPLLLLADRALVAALTADRERTVQIAAAEADAAQIKADKLEVENLWGALKRQASARRKARRRR